jgi:hypothetical protein
MRIAASAASPQNQTSLNEGFPDASDGIEPERREPVELFDLRG